MTICKALKRLFKVIALLGWAASSCAQTNEVFPARPVQMIIPVGAGGSTDVMMRFLANLAEPNLGQRIVIINRTGGSGMNGVAALTHAAADGYTISGAWNGPLTMAPHLQDAGYRPTDYTVVTMATDAPGVLCVAPSFPANNAQDFIKELKSKPGKYSYGNEGIGGFVHLSTERIFAKVEVKALAVPFSGANQTATSFIGGNVDIYGGGISSIKQFVDQGRAKCLLLSSSKRHVSLPKVESLTDIGLAELETTLWRTVIAPKGVPKDRLLKLQQAFEIAVRDPKFKEFSEARGEAPWLLSAEAANQYLLQEYEVMGMLVKKLGLAQK